MAIKSKIKRCNAEFNQTRQCNTSCLYYETPLHLYAFAFLGCIVLFSQNRGICLEALASLVSHGHDYLVVPLNREDVASCKLLERLPYVVFSCAWQLQLVLEGEEIYVELCRNQIQLLRVTRPPRR